ncbi:hypothetical protein L6V77_26560 [Myxococcota bacterium]|nr:hypothetical protein [Myxococcota bacterium]
MSARRHLSRVAAFVVAAVAGFAPGCQGPGEEAAGVGEACAESDLVAQCPPGSNPILGASATSMCEASASVDLLTESGSVSGRCFGEGTCRVVCQFASPCRCGVDAVTREGVFCTPCDEAAACGNGVCEGGETPVECPEDCSADCTPGEERCQGRDRESCDGTGHWALLACDAGTVCQVTAPALTACLRNDVAIGGETGQPVPREDQVDGRVWFGPGAMPPEGTGTALVEGGVAAGTGYTMEGLFFVEWNQNTRLPSIDITRAGYRYAPADAPEAVQWVHWQKYLIPADVEDGAHLVLWGPKRAVRFTLAGTAPPEGERATEVEYPAEMAGPPDDPLVGLSSRSVWSQDRRRVLWARSFQAWQGNGLAYLENAELMLFDTTTGENTLLTRTGIRTLSPAPLALTPDGRTAITPVSLRFQPTHGYTVLRDGLERRPLLPSRRGEVTTSPAAQVAVSPSGALLATSGGTTGGPVGFPVSCDPGVDLWNVATGERIYTLCAPAGETLVPSGLAFDPRGDRLAVTVGPAGFAAPNPAPFGVEIWDLTEGKERARITVGEAPQVAFLPDGRGLAVLTVGVNVPSRAELAIWDPQTGALSQRIFAWDSGDLSTLPSNQQFVPEGEAPPAEVVYVNRIEGFNPSPRGTRIVVYGSAGALNSGGQFVATFRADGVMP